MGVISVQAVPFQREMGAGWVTWKRSPSAAADAGSVAPEAIVRNTHVGEVPLHW